MSPAPPISLSMPENEKVLRVENENVKERNLVFKKYLFVLLIVCFTLKSDFTICMDINYNKDEFQTIV